MAESNRQKQTKATKLFEKRIWNGGSIMRNMKHRDTQVAFDNAISNGLIKNKNRWIYLGTKRFEDGDKDIFQRVNSDDSNPNNLIASKTNKFLVESA